MNSKVFKGTTLLLIVGKSILARERSNEKRQKKYKDNKILYEEKLKNDKLYRETYDRKKYKNFRTIGKLMALNREDLIQIIKEQNMEIKKLQGIIR